MNQVIYDLPPIIESTGNPVGGVPQAAMRPAPVPHVPVSMPEMSPLAPPIGYMGPTGPLPGDEKLYLRFYTKSVIDGERTRAEGRPIYKEVDYVAIHAPGDKNNIVHKKVGYEEAMRFGPRYEAFRRTRVNSKPDGVPLTEWPAITRAQCDELAHFHIHTVEQLAQLPDQLGQKFMGFFDLRRKAQAYLQQVKDDTYAIRVAEENDDLRRQVAQQTALLEKMSARLEALEGLKPI